MPDTSRKPIKVGDYVEYGGHHLAVIYAINDRRVCLIMLDHEGRDTGARMNVDPVQVTPTVPPAEIKATCLAIQAKWTPAEEMTRRDRRGADPCELAPLGNSAFRRCKGVSLPV